MSLSHPDAEHIRNERRDEDMLAKVRAPQRILGERRVLVFELMSEKCPDSRSMLEFQIARLDAELAQVSSGQAVKL